MSNLQSLANQHRAAIIAKDVALANQIAAQYRVAWQRFNVKLQQLLADMGADEDHDSLYWSLRLRQIEYSLLPLVQQDFGDFSRAAQNLIMVQIEDAARAGLQDGLALLRNELGEVRSVFGVPSERALDAMIQRLKVDQLFKNIDAQTYDLVRKRLITGLMMGENPRQVARDLARALSMPLNRVLTIARTESIMAYRSAALDTYRANDDVVTGWTWSAAAGACPFCQSMDGTHHSLDEEMDSHPNDRCCPLPDTKNIDDILSEVA